MHCLEGGFYMAGLTFVAPETVLPSFVRSVGGPDNLVALMPVLLPATFSTLGLFIAPLVERLERLKPFVVIFGMLQRLPYLAAGLLMLFMPQSRASLLFVVVATPVVSGLIGGVGVNAWMEMVTRMIPENLRASGWAIRYVIQGIMGIAAGLAIKAMLGRHAGDETTGYGWLHLICFGFLLLSAIAQLMMKESPNPRPAHPPHASYRAYLRELPRLLRGRTPLLRLVAARFTGMGWLMLVAFLSIHAIQSTGRESADVGSLVLASMIGSLFGNAFAGLHGNQRGGRAVMMFSRALCLSLCAALPFIHHFGGFLSAFFVLGFGLFVDRVGDLTFSAELCPVERRPTHLAILAFCQAISLVAATLISGFVFRATQDFNAVALLSGAFAAISLLILRSIPEVRGRGPAHQHLPPVAGESPPMA